jgi:hypothetical protein
METLQHLLPLGRYLQVSGSMKELIQRAKVIVEHEKAKQHFY